MKMIIFLLSSAIITATISTSKGENIDMFMKRLQFVLIIGSVIFVLIEITL